MVLVINFKTYSNATGEDAVGLAKICEKVSLETDKKVVVCVEPTDIFRVAEEVSIQVFSEHMDPVEPGKNTGKITWEALSKSDGEGTLVNHSEDRVPFEEVTRVVHMAKEHGLVVIVCAENPSEVAQFSDLQPDFIAIEPPELIGGDISVSKAQPDIIKKSVEASHGVPVLVGAGIKNSEDVRIALSLGAKGVLLASGITKSEDPERDLRDLLSGF